MQELIHREGWNAGDEVHRTQSLDLRAAQRPWPRRDRVREHPGEHDGVGRK
jgi:hypothetical protein